MKSHNKFILLFCCTALLLTGCWDTLNIEDRGFVIGIAIDLNENTDNEDIYKVTNQLVIPAGIGSFSKGNGGNEEPFLNITANGINIYHINESIASKTSKVPYFEHLKVIIVSEKIARTDHAFPKLLDTFIRDVKMRRGIKIIVAKGNDAKKILEYTTPEEKLPAIHLNKLLEQSNKNFGYLEAMSIGDIEEAHLGKKSFVIPLLEVGETLLYNSGVAFNGPKEKLVGKLTPREMQGIEIASRKPVEEVIKFKYKDKAMSFEIIRIENNISVDPSDIDNIKVKVNVKIIGSLKETFGELNLRNQKILKEVENALSDYMKGSIEQVVEKGQKELNTDILNIWERIASKDYRTWKQIKDNWEEGENYFSKASFDIEVITEIYSIGTSTKTD